MCFLKRHLLITATPGQLNTPTRIVHLIYRWSDPIFDHNTQQMFDQFAMYHLCRMRTNNPCSPHIPITLRKVPIPQSVSLVHHP